MKGKILVVDDEEAMRRTLTELLRLESYTVTSAGSGEAALKALKADDYDLMILDIKMPGMDGVTVLGHASEIDPDLQVILLTAHGSLDSAIKAIQNDVHDYLLKPVKPQELLNSVVSGLARRSESTRKQLIISQMEASIQQLKDVEKVETQAPTDQRLISLSDGVMVDLSRREVWRGKVKVNLTPTEGKLLEVMLENQGRVMTHRQLVFLVQGYDTTDWEAPEILRPLVSRLRRKLAHFPNGKNWIESVRGTGYVFEEKPGVSS